ncbi:MAG: hypothetical protein AAFZ80_12665 [Cyanobacteria bacterium P01_A01_bin.105]
MTQPTSLIDWVVIAGFIGALTGMLTGFSRVSTALTAGEISTATAVRDYSIFGVLTMLLCAVIVLIAYT